MKMKNVLLALMFILVPMVGYAGVTGWWYDPGAPGTGLAVEAQGTHFFGVVFDYQNEPVDGVIRPCWYLLSGEEVAANKYAGRIYYVENWGVKEPQYSYTDVGGFELSYNGVDARINYENTRTGVTRFGYQLTKFLENIGAKGSQNVQFTGWWVIMDGIGIFLEVVGDRMFAGKYFCFPAKEVDGHIEPGIPFWSSFTGNWEGTMANADEMVWKDGSHFGEANYVEPMGLVLGKAKFFMKDGQFYLDESNNGKVLEVVLTRFHF